MAILTVTFGRYTHVTVVNDWVTMMKFLETANMIHKADIVRVQFAATI